MLRKEFMGDYFARHVGKFFDTDAATDKLAQPFLTSNSFFAPFATFVKRKTNISQEQKNIVSHLSRRPYPYMKYTVKRNNHGDDSLPSRSDSGPDKTDVRRHSSFLKSCEDKSGSCSEPKTGMGFVRCPSDHNTTGAFNISRQTVNLQLIVLREATAVAKKTCPLSALWMIASLEQCSEERINSPISLSNTMKKSPKASWREPSVYRSSWVCKHLINLTIIRLPLFCPCLFWRVIRIEYTNGPNFGSYNTSWRVPLLSSSTTPVTHYDLHGIRVKGSVRSIPAVSLFTTSSRRT